MKAARVLHVVGSMNVGGAETMLMNVFRHMDRTKVQFDFLVFREDAAYAEEINELGGRLISMPMLEASGFASAMGRAAQVIKTNGPYRAVHSHINLASSVTLPAARVAGVPVRVAHSHSTADAGTGVVRSLYRAIARRLIAASATHLLACGEDAGAHLFGAQWRRRGEVLNNSVNVTDFLYPPRREGPSLRDAWGIDDEAMIIGSVGRLAPVKNHVFLLDVVVHLRAIGIDAHLLIAGEGELRRSLEDRARRLDVLGFVHLVGLRRDVPALLHSFDVFVMPSRHEGMPMALIEAQAAGTPSVVSASVTQEVDLGLGLLEFASLDSVDDWVIAIQEVRQRHVDPHRVRQALVEKRYDVDSAVSRLNSIYGVWA